MGHMKKYAFVRSAALCAAVVLVPSLKAELAWFEAEDASEKTLEGAVAGWGHKEVLSGEK